MKPVSSSENLTGRWKNHCPKSEVSEVFDGRRVHRVRSGMVLHSSHLDLDRKRVDNWRSALPLGGTETSPGPRLGVGFPCRRKCREGRLLAPGFTGPPRLAPIMSSFARLLPVQEPAASHLLDLQLQGPVRLRIYPAALASVDCLLMTFYVVAEMYWTGSATPVTDPVTLGTAGLLETY